MDHHTVKVKGKLSVNLLNHLQYSVYIMVETCIKWIHSMLCKDIKAFAAQEGQNFYGN